MASLTIRNIEESLKAKLRMRAARHGRSMEEEARQLLRQGLMTPQPSTGLGSRVSQRFQESGGIDLLDPKRSRPRRPPTFPPE